MGKHSQSCVDLTQTVCWCCFGVWSLKFLKVEGHGASNKCSLLTNLCLLSAHAVWFEDWRPAGSSWQTTPPQHHGSPPDLDHQLPGQGAPLLHPLLLFFPCHPILFVYILLLSYLINSILFSAFLLSPFTLLPYSAPFLSISCIISSPVCSALLVSFFVLWTSNLSLSLFFLFCFYLFSILLLVHLPVFSILLHSTTSLCCIAPLLLLFMYVALYGVRSLNDPAKWIFSPIHHNMLILILDKMTLSVSVCVYVCVCLQKALQLRSDEHIFKFIKSKFALGPTRYEHTPGDPLKNIQT